MLLFALLACTTSPSSSKSDCSEGGAGDLHLTLSLPDEDWETPPALAVYSSVGERVATVTEADRTLSLDSGVYTLVALRGTTAPEGVRTGEAFGLLHDTVQTVCLSDGETVEWGATWEEQPSSGKLWVTSGETAYAFEAAELADGRVTPAWSITVPSSNDLRGFAIDPMGDLWIATSPTYGARLVVYPPDGLDPVELSGDSLPADLQLQDLEFAPDGSLWALVSGSATGEVGLRAWSPAQAAAFLAKGALPLAPARTVTVDGMIAPEDCAFDPDGTLWIADFGGNQVLRVDLSTEDSVLTPVDAFTAGWKDGTGDHSLDGPTALGVDDEGRLWVNYWTSLTVARFDGTSSSAVARSPDLRVGSDVLDLPAGLALDHAGGAWFGDETQDGVGHLLAVDQGSGDASVDATSDEALVPTDLVFDPR